jgi:hypothetical protein
MNGRTDVNGRTSLVSRRAILEQLPAFVMFPALSGLQGGVAEECNAPSRGSQAASSTPCAACAACTSRFCRHKAVGRIPPDRRVEVKERH